MALVIVPDDEEWILLVVRQRPAAVSVSHYLPDVSWTNPRYFIRSRRESLRFTVSLCIPDASR